MTPQRDQSDDVVRRMHAAIDAGFAFIAYGLTIELLPGEEIAVRTHGDDSMTVRSRVRPIDSANTFFVDCVFTPELAAPDDDDQEPDE